MDNKSEDVNEDLYKDCIKQSGNESIDKAEAAFYILEELWRRLQVAYKLRVVK